MKIILKKIPMILDMFWECEFFTKNGYKFDPTLKKFHNQTVAKTTAILNIETTKNTPDKV